jgi:hypothetical protein
MSFEQFYKQKFGDVSKTTKATAPAKETKKADVKKDTKVETKADDVKKEEPKEEVKTDVVIEDMTKKEIVAFAKKEHEIKIDPNQSKTKVIDELTSKIENKKEK